MLVLDRSRGDLTPSLSFLNFFLVRSRGARDTDPAWQVPGAAGHPPTCGSAGSRSRPRGAGRG